MNIRAHCFALAALAVPLQAAGTLWTFGNPANRLAADAGTGTLTYYDSFIDDWGPTLTQYGKAAALGLPALPGGDADVMRFPACTPAQGYSLTHGALANGVYGDSDGRVSNYTLVMDVLYPAASDGKWRALLQTDPFNSSDADFFVQNAASGGVGINSTYAGKITPDQWHRVVITVRAAPGEGHCQKYIDGTFVGGQGTTGSGLDLRWALEAEALLFADEDGETAEGYCASLAFVDRPMFPSEVAALGGPHASGALTPGTPAAAPVPMARRVGVIGHRGGAFNRAPDNTLAAIRAGIADGVQGIEVDTRVSADGICVAFHDSTVDRTTNGTGAVEFMTLAELKALDAGSWYDPSFAAERVPALSEVFAEAKNKCIILLDIKTGGQGTFIRDAVTAAGFPMSDLWCWTTDESAAFEIRSAMPTAQLMWGGPDASWSTDPNYFTNLKALGVIGFSYGAGDGVTDARFCARAKEEGMIVEIFTILTPDAMRAAALSGVDYVENDYPSTMNSLQPVQTPAASHPFPANGAVDVSRDLVMRWVTGTGATQRKVWFGTTAPGTDLGVRTSDLLARNSLAYGTTYYWRVDEMNGAVTTPGPVWSFTTLPVPPTANLVGLWLFDRSDDLGHATIGTDLAIEGFAPEWAAEVADDTGRTVSGVIRTVVGPDNRLRCTHGIGANGGGLSTNRYTMVTDVFTPVDSRFTWRCLLQTSEANSNDGDYFFRDSDDAVGVAAIGYGPAINAGEWTRLVFTVDLNAVTSASAIRTYLNGGAAYVHTPQALDGRFSLSPAFLFAGDEDGENNPLQIGMLALYDGAISEAEVAALGATRSAGLFPVPVPAISATGGSVQLQWPSTPGYLLQRSPDLSNWSDLGATFGLGTYSEPLTPAGRAWFRLAPR